METQTKTEPGKIKKGVPIQKITPFLWFDNQTEEAVNFYLTVFNNSKIKTTTRYGEEGAKATGMPENSVMTMAFQIEGLDYVAINGGPVFQINPTISFFVNCETIQEIERLWGRLSENGTIMMELDSYPFAEKYGWLQDKFGVSWQIVPNVLGELLSHPDKGGNVMQAMLKMKKLDIKMLQDAVVH